MSLCRGRHGNLLIHTWRFQPNLIVKRVHESRARLDRDVWSSSRSRRGRIMSGMWCSHCLTVSRSCTASRMHDGCVRTLRGASPNSELPVLRALTGSGAQRQVSAFKQRCASASAPAASAASPGGASAPGAASTAAASAGAAASPASSSAAPRGGGGAAADSANLAPRSTTSGGSSPRGGSRRRFFTGPGCSGWSSLSTSASQRAATAQVRLLAPRARPTAQSRAARTSGAACSDPRSIGRASARGIRRQ